MNFMKTLTPQQTTLEEDLSIRSVLKEAEICTGKSSIEMPLQQMFDEFLVFISKNDFE